MGATMKAIRSGVLFSLILPALLCACAEGGEKATSAAPDGKALFELHCVSCHSGGGNTVNPARTLSKSDRESNGIKSPGDIVRVMRNPGPGMPKFGQATLPEDQARAIAEYVVKNF